MGEVLRTRGAIEGPKELRGVAGIFELRLRRARWFVAVSFAVCGGWHSAGAQVPSAATRVATRWPLHVPALSAVIDDPGDGRAWTVSTRIDADAVTITATIPGNGLAVTMRRVRTGVSSCRTMVAQLFRTPAVEPFVAAQPDVFRGPPWESEAFRQSSATHDGEFGCLTAGPIAWLGSVVAQPRAGVALTDAAAFTRALGRALRALAGRPEYPALLETAGLTVNDPRDRAAWTFLGRSADLGIGTDTVASSAGEPGGVTLAVTVRAGTCESAWNAVRPALASEGSVVDRPGYVPSGFGARIHRVVVQDRMREFYCASVPRGALIVGSVFRVDDADAMDRMTAMLRAVVDAAARASGAGGPADAGVAR